MAAAARQAGQPPVRLPVAATDVRSSAPRNASQPLPATSRWRVSAKLTTREVQHRVGREEREVGQGHVGARDQPVDLVGLGGQQRLVAAERGAAGAAARRVARVAERLGQALHGEQAPGDAGREERVHEGEAVGQQGPARARGAGQAVLDAAGEADGEDGRASRNCAPSDG